MVHTYQNCSRERTIFHTYVQTTIQRLKGLYLAICSQSEARKTRDTRGKGPKERRNYSDKKG